MYATQTYLGFTVGDARLYIYAITETYRDERSKHLCEEFRRRVSEFGLSTGGNIAVVMSHEGHQDRTNTEIKSDTNEKMQEFYRKNISGKTPGLLLTKSPVDQPKAWQGAFYIPFDGVEHPFRESKKLIEQIQNIPNSKNEERRFLRLLKKVNDFVILRPSIFGMGFNVNQILASFLDRR